MIILNLSLNYKSIIINLLMKNNIILLLILAIISSCEDDDHKTSYFAGKIIKNTNDKISLLKDEFVINETFISEDGSFHMVLDSINNGLYNFKHLPEVQYVIFETKDSLVLRLNAVDFDESLVFSGKGSSKNNYLIDVFLEHENQEKFINSNLRNSPANFKKLIDSLLKLKKLKFDNFKKLKKLNKTSITIINNAIKLPLYSKMEAYISGIKQKNLLNTLNYDFYDFREDIDLNVEELSNFKPYLDYIILRTNNESVINYSPYSNLDFDFNLDRIRFVKSYISNPVIKSKILRYIAFEYLLKDNPLIDIDSFLNEFLKISIDDKINIEIEQLYSNISLLQIGKTLPEIELTNEFGDSISSIELKLNKPIIYVFWSYDQNSHQNSLFNRVFEFLNKNKNYIFHCININSNQKKWRESLNYIKKDNSIKHYITNDFHTMSKKMILNNLNKIIITDNKGKIISISNIIELDSNLN